MTHATASLIALVRRPGFKEPRPVTRDLLIGGAGGVTAEALRADLNRCARVRGKVHGPRSWACLAEALASDDDAWAVAEKHDWGAARSSATPPRGGEQKRPRHRRTLGPHDRHPTGCRPIQSAVDGREPPPHGRKPAPLGQAGDRALKPSPRLGSRHVCSRLDILMRYIEAEHRGTDNRFPPTRRSRPIGAVALRLKPSAYLMLGMVRAGVGTGYAIKRAVDQTTRFFWATSFAQIYPELARLEQEGYLVGHDDPQGNRPRRTYDLTDKGRGALDDWLQTPRVPGFEFRDEGLLRLFFADALPEGDAIALVERLREQAERANHDFRANILPIAEGAPEHGFHFPLIAARLGADYYGWRARWLADLQAELETAGRRTDSTRAK